MKFEQRQCIIIGCGAQAPFGAEFCNGCWFSLDPKLRREVTIAKHEFARERAAGLPYRQELKDAEAKYVGLRRRAIEEMDAKRCKA